MPNIRSALAVAAAAFLLTSGIVSAQTTLLGTRALDDKINDINRDAQREIDRAQDNSRFGNEQFAPGITGSMSASYAGTTGNTDTQDLTVAGRLHYNSGLWNHSIGLSLEFGEDANVRSKEEAFAILDSTYDLSEQIYLFGLGRFQYDTFGPLRQDAFLGFGPGYRIINTESTAWRVQAGPGVRYTKVTGVNSDTEVAGILSSRFFYRLSPTTFLTNDTDVLGSDVGTLVSNDFGISLAMTDTLATRLSLRTEYNTNAVPGTKKADNTIGVSLVYSFN